MKTKEIKNKKIEDLTKELFEKKESLRVIRAQVSGSKNKNVKETKNIRRDVARILTEINTRKK